MPEGAVATLDLDALADRMASRYRLAMNQPEPGSERVVRFGQDGSWEILGEQQPWWQSFAQVAPDPGTLIEVTREGPRPLEGASALDRLQTYEFGQRRPWLDFIERPLNDAFRQFPYLGSILVGGFPALLTSEAVDGFVEGSNLSPQTQTWVKAGAKAAIGVGVPVLIGNQIMSRTGQFFYGGTLLLSAARDFSPINDAVKNIIIWVRNLFRPAGNKLPYAQDLGGSHALGALRHDRMLAEGRWGLEHGIGDARYAQNPPGVGGVGPHPLVNARGF